VFFKQENFIVKMYCNVLGIRDL